MFNTCSKNRAYSIAVERFHGMEQVGVRLPVGPPRCADLVQKTPLTKTVLVIYLKMLIGCSFAHVLAYCQKSINVAAHMNFISGVLGVIVKATMGAFVALRFFHGVATTNM